MCVCKPIFTVALLTSDLQILHWLGITKIDRMLSMSKYALPHKTYHAV